MREKTALSSQNEKKGTKGKKIVGTALAATLLVTPAVSSAQKTNVSEKKQDKKEIVEKTPIITESDSTITWDEAVSGPNLEPDLEGREVSQEEIQEYIKNHEKEIKEEILKSIKEKKLDEETREIIYKEIMGSEKIQRIIEEMVNRDDVRQAVLEGNEEYIKQEVSRDMVMVGVTKWSIRWRMIMSSIVFLIWGVVFGRKMYN